MKIPLLAVLLFLTTAPLRADDLSQFLKKPDAKTPAASSKPVAPEIDECKAQNLPSGGGCTTTSFCRDVESCRRFCCCACDTHGDVFWQSKDGKHGWWEDSAYSDQVTCERAPQTADGIIAPDSDQLLDLSRELRGADTDHLLDLSSKRATRAVVDGLRQLNGIIRDWPSKPKGQDIKVRVHNCYRRAIGNHTRPQSTDGNAEAVCHMMLKMMHVENSPNSTDDLKEEWHRNAENKFRMTWPGPNPHASGVACDLVLVDAAGDDCFDVGTGKYSKHSCSFDDRTASKILDDAVTQTGGKRLDFEAWHYEWGGIDACRCQHPNCAKDFFPATGSQSQCP